VAKFQKTVTVIGAETPSKEFIMNMIKSMLQDEVVHHMEGLGFKHSGKSNWDLGRVRVMLDDGELSVIVFDIGPEQGVVGYKMTIQDSAGSEVISAAIEMVLGFENED
jgi:hypothetical protein